MPIIQTSELTDETLDWAVGLTLAKHMRVLPAPGRVDRKVDVQAWCPDHFDFIAFEPSSDLDGLAAVMPDIQKLEFFTEDGKTVWAATTHSGLTQRGPNPQVAAARAHVEHYIGKQVAIPSELIEPVRGYTPPPPDRGQASTRQKTVQELREAGTAVVIFSAEELNGADRQAVESRLVEFGNEVIEDLQPAPHPQDH